MSLSEPFPPSPLSLSSSSPPPAMEQRLAMGRKDIFRMRKQNTSRPPSMHVDDFMAIGVRPSLIPRPKDQAQAWEQGYLCYMYNSAMYYCSFSLFLVRCQSSREGRSHGYAVYGPSPCRSLHAAAWGEVDGRDAPRNGTVPEERPC